MPSKGLRTHVEVVGGALCVGGGVDGGGGGAHAEAEGVLRWGTFTNDVRNSWYSTQPSADIIFESSFLSVDGGRGDGALLDGGRVADGAVARLAPEADRVLLVREVRHCRKQQRVNKYSTQQSYVFVPVRIYLLARVRLRLSGSCS